MKEAFTYMFKDKMFTRKAFIYFIISSLAYFFINYSLLFTTEGIQQINQITITSVNPLKAHLLLFIGIFFKLLTSGYYLNTIGAITAKNNNYVLPFFNFKSCFIKGIKLILSILFIVFIFGGILLVSSILKPYFLILLIIISVILGPCFLWMMANENEYLVLFHINDAIKLVKNNCKNYFKTFGLLWLAIATSLVISFGLEKYISFLNMPIWDFAIISILYSIVDAYFIYVYSYLIAKSIKAESVV